MILPYVSEDSIGGPGDSRKGVGNSMNDWGMSVLSQYPVTVRTTRKVRGALLCDTKEGLYLLSEYRGKQARLEAEAALLLYLAYYQPGS